MEGRDKQFGIRINQRYRCLMGCNLLSRFKRLSEDDNLLL